MPPLIRKFTLTVHIVASIGWIGAVVAYLVLGVSAKTSADPESVRAAWIGMDLVGWSAIVPLAAGSLLTGLVVSLGTPWGLFRYYWVLVSLALTVLCTVVLVLHMPEVSSIARFVREAGTAAREPLGGDLVHPGLGLVVLLIVAGINVYKPRGLTRYGWRKQCENRGSSPP